MTRDNNVSAIAQLYRIILDHGGSIPTVRVSSAQAQGRAKRYSYWGTAHYELCVNSKGWPCNRVVRGARSDRRSYRLACQDANETGKLMCGCIGQLTEHAAEQIISRM
jgi:hypothetical protein